MRCNRCKRFSFKQLCGMLLSALGLGMLLSFIIPACLPLIAIALIGIGIYLLK